MDQEVYIAQYFAEGVVGLIITAIFAVSIVVGVILLWKFCKKFLHPDSLEVVVPIVVCVCLLSLFIVFASLFVNITKVINPKYYVLERQGKTQQEEWRR